MVWGGGAVDAIVRHLMSTKADNTPLCRLLSKRGLASRKRGAELARAGRVKVNGRVQRDPERWVSNDSRIEIDDVVGQAKPHRVFMMNKKRGVISSRSDPYGRPVVCDHPLLRDTAYAPVGRLDKASEGLLLFTNDTLLADRLTSPGTHMTKTYHVKIDRLLRADELQALGESIDLDGELSKDSMWTTLRHGEKNSWVQVELREGKNRQIRRMLEQLDVKVQRLIRVGVGALVLGDLAKGDVRELSPQELGRL